MGDKTGPIIFVILLALPLVALLAHAMKSGLNAWQKASLPDEKKGRQHD